MSREAIMTTKKYFGTDGIRGEVGKFPISADFVLKLGWAVGKVLAHQGGDKVLIGKDTRISGYMFESALEAGLSAAGIDVHLLGPMPTPAIAYLTRTLRASIGIVISASHNLYHDNGIKFFSSEGFKLDDDFELLIEKKLEDRIATVDSALLGRAYRVKDARGRYIEFCKSSVPHYACFKGLKIVLDCANGANYYVAPKIFRELQAKVITINNDPNGLNINNLCGSTHPECLQRMVIKEKADLGIAFDGDGDRVIMVDHKGEIVDGDELLYIIAKSRRSKERFYGGIVGTIMSNMGLELALKAMDIPFKRTQVGDQHVLHSLIQEGWKLGGESSGHIVCLDITTTGDGIVSALQVLEAMSDQQKSLHELKSEITKFPQIMVNVKHNGNTDFLQNSTILRCVKDIEQKLKHQGRLVMRVSGTEPVIRVMVEAQDHTLAQTLANQLVSDLRQFIVV